MRGNKNAAGRRIRRNATIAGVAGAIGGGYHGGAAAIGNGFGRSTVVKAALKSAAGAGIIVGTASAAGAVLGLGAARLVNKKRNR